MPAIKTPAAASATAGGKKAQAHALPPSVFKLPQTPQLEALYTIIRDRTTSRGDFLFYSDRIIRLLVEEGLNHLPVIPKTVETPTVSTIDMPRARRILTRKLTTGPRARRMKVSDLRARFVGCRFSAQARCVSGVL